MSVTAALPPVVVFDLDGTLWNPEMYQLWGSGGAPFRHAGSSPTGHVVDKKGNKVDLIGDTREVLASLIPAVASGVTCLAVASTCDEPEWARELLHLFRITNTDSATHVPLMSLFKGPVAIYHAPSKVEHFTEIQELTGVPFHDMVFFDNQRNNIDAVSRLAVHCVYCPEGLTRHYWDQGVDMWTRGQASAPRGGHRARDTAATAAGSGRL